MSAESFGEEEDGEEEEEEEEEKEEESDLEGTAPTPKRRKLAREKALTNTLGSGLRPVFMGIEGPSHDAKLTQVIAMVLWMWSLQGEVVQDNLLCRIPLRTCAELLSVFLFVYIFTKITHMHTETLCTHTSFMPLVNPFASNML